MRDDILRIQLVFALVGWLFAILYVQRGAKSRFLKWAGIICLSVVGVLVVYSMTVASPK